MDGLQILLEFPDLHIGNLGHSVQDSVVLPWVKLTWITLKILNSVSLLSPFLTGFPTQGPNPSCSPSNPQQPWSYPFPTQPPFRSPNMKSGMRFRRPPQCPPRFRHPYPSQTLSSTYHSTLQSPVMSKKFTEQVEREAFTKILNSNLLFTSLPS